MLRKQVSQSDATNPSAIAIPDWSELRRQVSDNEIKWEDALAMVMSLGKKPWQTKEWKERRKALLGDRCVQCGSANPPLVLQHTKQPRPVDWLYSEVRQQYREEWGSWKERHPEKLDLCNVPPDADGCPKCFSPTVRYRKRAKTWICVTCIAGVACGNVFETPVRVVSNSTIIDLGRAFRKQRQDSFDAAFDVGQQVVLLAIDERIRYMSLEDTTTFCKRCAFVADKTRMVLCAECRKSYHARHYPRCSKCAGVEPVPFDFDSETLI